MLGDLEVLTGTEPRLSSLCVDPDHRVALPGARCWTTLGGRSRPTVDFSAIVPADGARGEVPTPLQPIRGGLTGEIAALLLESGTHPKSARVAVESTIPFAPYLECAALPNAGRIAVAKGLA